jgi:nucleoside-diphosphate-sugar epimerase
MRVFVTGATGFVGSAVTAELLAAGHAVVGLTRSDDAAAALRAAGAEPHRGDLEDPASLQEAAGAADGVIHCAFIHDFSRLDHAGAVDHRAIEAIGAALAGSDRPFVITSGLALLPPGRAATEDQEPQTGGPGSHRVASERAAKALAERGVRSSIVRLAPTVHDAGDHGFVPALIDIARARGVSGHVGDGANRWPAVHRLDAARLYRLALEQAPPGAVLHGAAERGIPTRDIAAAIARGLGVPLASIPAAEAPQHFGWLAPFFATDIVASSALTRDRLGWTPEHPGLLADLGAGHYFSGHVPARHAS